MKKLLILILCAHIAIHADAAAVQDAPLTIHEAFTALERIMGNLTCLAFAPEHAAAFNHVAALMNSCMHNAQDLMHANQIQSSAPLSQLVNQISQTKIPANTVLKTKSPIDDLEASTQKPNKPQPKAVEDDHLTDTVLASFLNCCGHFAAITSNPKNPNVVRPHILAMVGNILNVAREACRRSTGNDLQIKDLAGFTDIVLEQAYAIRVTRLQGA